MAKKKKKNAVKVEGNGPPLRIKSGDIVITTMTGSTILSSDKGASDMRIVQRNLVYVIGLAPGVATEEVKSKLLQRYLLEREGEGGKEREGWG